MRKQRLTLSGIDLVISLVSSVNLFYSSMFHRMTQIDRGDMGSLLERLRAAVFFPHGSYDIDPVWTKISISIKDDGTTKKINVIKSLRELTGLGLKDSKDVVEGVVLIAKTSESGEAIKMYMRIIYADEVTVLCEHIDNPTDLPTYTMVYLT
jgi:hypothetical protein